MFFFVFFFCFFCLFFFFGGGGVRRRAGEEDFEARNLNVWGAGNFSSKGVILLLMQFQ